MNGRSVFVLHTHYIVLFVWSRLVILSKLIYKGIQRVIYYAERLCELLSRVLNAAGISPE